MGIRGEDFSAPLAVPALTNSHRLWQDVEASLLPLTRYSLLHTSVLICIQNSGTAHTGLQKIFQRDNEALGSDSKCGGGGENIPQGNMSESVYVYRCSWV